MACRLPLSRMIGGTTSTMNTTSTVAAEAAASACVVDPEIFESVQRQIDEDSQLREVRPQSS